MNSLDNIKVGFIGAGKVGVSLGAYFRSKGICVDGYVSRSPLSSQAAAEITSSQAFKNIAELVEQCEIISITTPDDQIGNVWSEMARCNIKGKIICHISIASKNFSNFWLKDYTVNHYLCCESNLLAE